MLEMLLIFACMNGTEQSCMQSGDALFKYHGVDQIVEKFGNDYPVVSHTVAAMALFKEKKTFFQVNGPWYYEVSMVEDDFESDLTNRLWWKKEF